MAAREVRLTWSEVRLAAEVGISRQIRRLYNGSAQTFGAKPDEAWERHITGALGELATAKYLGRYWGGVTDQTGPGDLGDGLEVRHTRRNDGRLIVHDTDPDTAAIYLATGCEPVFNIRGWILAGDAKRPHYWTDPGTGRPAYFVPQADLIQDHDYDGRPF